MTVIDKKLISLKEASSLLSMSYNYFSIMVRKKAYLGVFRIGGRYKIDFSTFKLNFNEDKIVHKVSFEKLKRYFDTECAYWNTITQNTISNTRKALKEAELFFYDKDFTKENIYLWRNDLKAQGKADGTIRKYLGSLSKMCEECIKVGLLDINPCLSTREGLKKEVRTAFLTPEERNRLLAVCYEDLADKINFAIETGLRRGEQFSLVWDRVFLKEREILITETKTNRDRTVPLSPPALEILKKRRHLAQPFVGYNAKDYKQALKKANITKHITWHDLRRTFGMWLIKGWHPWAKGNMNKSIIGKYLGHLNEKTTSIYASLDVKDLHNLINQDLYYNIEE
ncbi:Site-specific recombinase [Candidatus Hepatincolaceae symbiont of Richtersius coronifer]